MYGLHAREMNLLRGGAVFVQKDMHVCGCCVLRVACCVWGRTGAKANLIRRVGHGFGSARILLIVVLWDFTRRTCLVLFLFS